MEEETNTAPSADVAIIGGGLAGLTAAAIVAASGKRAVVYERHRSFGGDARSSTHDGFTFNQGPHALYRGGPAERILGELSVQMRGGAPSANGRVVFDDVSFMAPAGATTLLRSKGFSGRDKIEIAKVLGQVPRLRPAKLATTTVDAWIDSVVTRERPRQLLRTISRLSTYGNHPAEMSAEVTATQMKLALGPGVLYLHGGWQTLVDQLAGRKGISTITGDAITELPDAPAVIIAAGGPTLASKLLGRSFDVGPAAEVSSVDLGLSRRPDHDLVLGGDVPFYFSNHSAAANLAPVGNFCATGLQYLGPDDSPDSEAIRRFIRHAGIEDDDIVFERKLHSMTASSAIATANRGGFAGRPSVDDTGHANVFIAGDWVAGEGHLADAAIASGKAAALAAVEHLSKVGS